MFSELIWTFYINDVKICHELEPKYLRANLCWNLRTHIKQISVLELEYCYIFVCWLVCFLRSMMCQRKDINWTALTITATLFPEVRTSILGMVLSFSLQVWLHPSLLSAHWFVDSVTWFEPIKFRICFFFSMSSSSGQVQASWYLVLWKLFLWFPLVIYSVLPLALLCVHLFINS